MLLKEFLISLKKWSLEIFSNSVVHVQAYTLQSHVDVIPTKHLLIKNCITNFTFMQKYSKVSIIRPCLIFSLCDFLNYIAIEVKEVTQ